MSSLFKNIQYVVEYIESNLTEKITVKDIAEKAYLSEFHFRRVFRAIFGFTVSEYIRKRRLTLAAQELSTGNAKVIEVANKYGYESPDSFTRAFIKFHGIIPSAAKEKGAKLQNFLPLKIDGVIEGGSVIEYRIVEKESFTIVGKKRRFASETSYDEIPKFWDEHYADRENTNVIGTYGVCMDYDGKCIDYYIADLYADNKEMPIEHVKITLPAGVWAVFPCALRSLQETNTKIWREWIIDCKEYNLNGNYNVEMYATYGENNSQERYCEIWLPLVKKK